MKLNFLAVGDIHFESLARYIPEGDYITPITSTLKQIWEYAKDNAIEHIVLVGDIFDNPFPKDETKKAFLKCLDKKLQYHIILGNHDFANTYENSLNLCKYFVQDLGLMENVKFYLKPEVVEINNVKLNFLPFPYKTPTCPPPAICFGHFETKGSISDSGRVFKDGAILDENYTWILGHLHRQQGLIYPGSICQHKFGEPVNKYFFDVKVNSDDSVEINKVSINTPYKLLDVVINSLEDLNNFKKENIYRLYVAEHLDLTEIKKRTEGFQIWQIYGVNKDTKTGAQLNEEDIAYQEQNFADELVYLKTWLEEHCKNDLTEEQIELAIKQVEEWKSNPQ